MFAKTAVLLLASAAIAASAPGCASAQRRDEEAASVMLERAKSFYDAGRFGKAESAFEELTDQQVYARGCAEEASFLVGECRFQRRDFVGAHKAYSGLLKGFRGSEYFDTAVEREFVIGAAFCTGRQSTFWKGRRFGAKVLKEALEYQPFTGYAAEARMVLGGYYFDKRDYDEAARQYDILVRDFPGTREARIAKYRKGLCLYHGVQGNRYDTEETEKAIEELELARKDLSQPGQDYREPLNDIDSKLNDLREVGAKENYDIGRFFLKNKNKKAAATYFYAVLQEAPKSSYAEPARRELDRIQQEINQ